MQAKERTVLFDCILKSVKKKNTPIGIVAVGEFRPDGANIPTPCAWCMPCIARRTPIFGRGMRTPVCCFATHLGDSHRESTRRRICRALQGFRHGSGAAMFRPPARAVVCIGFNVTMLCTRGVRFDEGSKKEWHPNLGCHSFLVTRRRIELLLPP